MAENTYDKTSEIRTLPGTTELTGPMGADRKIQFTGIVVTYNEAQHLRDCLNSLSFCEQLIVVDLGSTDASVEIAKQCGAQIVNHRRVPIVEQVREEARVYARNDWIIFTDPDEVLPAQLVNQLREVIDENPDAAIVRVPLQFYFRGKQLDCCIWGRPNSNRILLIHKGRVQIGPLVHRGYEKMDGFREIYIPRHGDNFIRHYWMDSYSQLIAKHLRYSRHEGESRYNSGQRFSWSSMFIDVERVLKANLIEYRGLYGGFTGVFLSFFYCWYAFMSWLSLRKYERRHSYK